MMNISEHEEFDENFLKLESKVDQLAKLLDDVVNANKTDADTMKKDVGKKVEIDWDHFCVIKRPKQGSVAQKKQKLASANIHLDHFSFMKQIDQTPEERMQMRLYRMRVAQNFRNLGNEEYRNMNNERAIYYYTKAMENIKDSPILYCNRAICFIKLRNYKRAIFDCNFVLQNIDPNHIRSWLYLAAAYRRCNEEKMYEFSKKMVRELNPKAAEEIATFFQRMQSEL